MTSGEWDLRALKALEEEEQKEFLALSQKSLFEPPSPPSAASAAAAKQQPHHHQLLQHHPHAALAASSSPSTLAYAQLHPHLLKLPTINEYNLIAAKRQQQQQAASHGAAGRLKFSRALSLSAHSLSGRSQVSAGGGSASGGGGGGGGGVFGFGFGRKLRSKFAASKSSGSLSPQHYYSASPVYTPPPIRRCATLHHTQPVRKTFKTLQQLDRQKQERKREAAAASLRASGGGSSSGGAGTGTGVGVGGASGHRSPTLQRVAGTNKTFWKYGANSTAASIIGQRSAASAGASATSTAIGAAGLQPHELDSNTSDEHAGAEEVEQLQLQLRASDQDDNATETGSCSVPLAADSNELMRLMLNAASTAVTTQPTAGMYAMPPKDTVTATGGAENHTDNEDDIVEDDGNSGANSNLTFLALSRYPPFRMTMSSVDPSETVAYEAFHARARRKSFSGSLLWRANSLTESSPVAATATVTATATAASNSSGQANSGANRKILKAISVDAPPACLDYLVEGGAFAASGAAGGAAGGAGHGGIQQRSTIITNPIVEGIRSAATTLNKASHMCNLPKTPSAAAAGAATVSASTSAASSTLAATSKAATSKLGKMAKMPKTAMVSLHYSEDGGLHHHQQLLPHQHQHHHHHQQQQQQQQQLLHSHPHPHPHHHHLQHVSGASLLCQDALGSTNGSSSSSPQPNIDDELEQHIKHCSCSCNHMGYGNSMDYQTTGFGGLPDVTEHSNIRRTLSRQNSITNSGVGGDASNRHSHGLGLGLGVGIGIGTGEIASIQKSKLNYGEAAKSPTSTSSGGGGGIGGGGAAGVAGASVAAAAVTSTAGATTTNGSKRKSKAAAAQRYKGRRSSCAVALTLLAALCLLAIAATLAYQHFLMSPSRNSHAQRLRIVRRILREVPLVDGHNNFAWNVRKYAHSSLELVHLSHDLDQKTIWTRPVWAQTDMERLKQGLVGVQVWSAYVPCEAQGLDAVQLALEQIDIVRRLADMYSTDTTLVTTSQEIVAARRRGLMASLIAIEGGHAMGSSLGVLRSFYSLGARSLSLTHRCDVSWAGSSNSLSETGLSQFGRAIIREMNRLGMMIDLSYSSDATARDVLQATRAPVIFSHSAARHLCNSTRNVPDDILRLVAENGGLVMISFDSEDVACGRHARMSDVVEHINYVRSIAGVQHIGLGAGYDSIEAPPVGLEDVSKYPDLLATLLEDHNWSEEDVAMLAGKNFLRIMETVENVRDYWKRAAIQPIEQTEPQPKSQCTYMSS